MTQIDIILVAILHFCHIVHCRGQYHSSEESSSSIYPELLPLCCSSRKGNIGISSQCLNSLRSTSQHVYFRRKSWIVPNHLMTHKQALKFKFKATSLQCKYGHFKVILPALPISTQSRNNNLSESQSYFLKDGHFIHKNEIFRPDGNEFCLSGLTDKWVELSICNVNCSDPATPCINKCCLVDSIYSFGYGDHPRGCIRLNDADLHQNSNGNRLRWTPTLYHNHNRKLSPKEHSSLRPHITQQFPTSFKQNCAMRKTTVFPFHKNISQFLSDLTRKPFRNLEFRLRKDGWLLYPRGMGGRHSAEQSTEVQLNNHPVAKKIDNYCIDGARDYGESEDFIFSNEEGQTILFLCSGGVDEAFELQINSSLPIPRLTPPTQTPNDPAPSQPNPDNTTHKPSLNLFQRLKDKIALEISQESGTSLEIEIEDGVSSNSLERRGDVAEESREIHSKTTSTSISTSAPKPKLGPPVPNHFIPAQLKVSVQVPQIAAQAQVPRRKLTSISHKTTFNNNNLKTVDSHRDMFGDGSGSEMQTFSEEPTTFSRPSSLPTCCPFFAANPNDELSFSHHCKNQRSGGATDEKHLRKAVDWNMPFYFMSNNKSSRFLLQTNPVKCGRGIFQFQGFINDFDQNRARTLGERKHGILAGSYLKYDNEFYSPNQYCVNGLSSRVIEVLICKPDCSMWETPCIQKCCGLDEIYNLGLQSGVRGCQPLDPNDSQFIPILYGSMRTPVPFEEMKQITPHFIQKYPPSFQPSCYNKITLAFPYSREIAEKLTPGAGKGGFKHLQFRFRKDGKLMYAYPETDGTSFDAVYDREEYCVDAVRDYGESTFFNNNENQTVLFICASEPQSEEQHHKQ